MEPTTEPTWEPTLLPPPAEVGRRAAQILAGLEADPGYERLSDSSKKYIDCWATFTGYPTIARWNLDQDKDNLFREAMRALSLKGAVYELTGGNEHASELMLSPPVDEMTHAVLAQHTLITQMQVRLGVLLPHMTDEEQFYWEPGDYTEDCYHAAGWGDLDPRYWIGVTEARRRLDILNSHYNTIGIHGMGRSHDFDFAQPVAA